MAETTCMVQRHVSRSDSLVHSCERSAETAQHKHWGHACDIAAVIYLPQMHLPSVSAPSPI